MGFICDLHTATTLVKADEQEEITLTVEFNESLLILCQLSSAWHLINLPLHDGNLSVPPSL